MKYLKQPKFYFNKIIFNFNTLLISLLIELPLSKLLINKQDINIFLFYIKREQNS